MRTTALVEPTTATGGSLTYPLSPDYVADWTSDRAAAELIANALDEDPCATVVYTDGRLVITDNGRGIPEEGFILGYSDKDSSAIGQFGEGAKVASLVLARDPEVGAVKVETVGYGFIPTVETRNFLTGIAPRHTTEPPKLLVYTFVPSTRAAGTQVSIECSQELADAAISRFRHLTEPGYTPPQQDADILLTGTDSGRLYIGGVLVSRQKRWLASYDFPLALAKSAQNRDRTVIDASELVSMVTQALAACTDETVIETFASAALAGHRFNEAEKYFHAVTDPRVKAAFRAVGARLFADRSVFYTSANIEEEALYLLDGDFELLTTNLDQLNHMRLMELLGVERSRQAVRTNHVRNHNRTKYVALNKLTAAERTVLTAGIEQVKAVFGPDALDKVKVYHEAADPALACADGFYTPSDRSVSVARDALADPHRTLEVLLHEAAHRRAHQRGIDFSDRTRGFEAELTTMLAAAVAALAVMPAGTGEEASGALAGDATDGVAAAGSAPARAAGVAAADDPFADKALSVLRRELASLVTDALPAACEKAGVENEAQLSDRMALHRNYLRYLLNPKPIGWRQRPGAMSPSMVSDYRKLAVIGTTLGITPAALWLGHLLGEGPRYGRPGGAARPGAWSKRIQADVEAVARDLEADGKAYAAVAAQLRACAAGEVDTTGGVDEWTAFALPVLATERQRLGLT